ncbi:transcription factor ATOH8 [Pseudophryne corroboree]|uniref:transcription factor ATOH8 n=1 Tax=Pseudophryne corroboree TaxID=495146 RepID=UPI003081759D
MRSPQVLEGPHWKGHCIPGIPAVGIRKRKSREGIQQTFTVDLKVEARGKGAEQEQAPGAGLMEDALDLRSGSLAGKTGLLPYVGEQRTVLCQRPPDTSYLSVSQVTDPCASPMRRLGETAGVSTEIKAIQQTRRLLANARERSRVHTISAAFEALRKQVPCYSYGQKLSKLAILRIACNYILSLARLADLDYTADHSNLSFSECVEQCTRTLQSEGRSKKRKE